MRAWKEDGAATGRIDGIVNGAWGFGDTRGPMVIWFENLGHGATNEQFPERYGGR